MTTNAILARESFASMPTRQPKSTPSSDAAPAIDDPRWNAVIARDAARDGEFVFAVSTTGVYCRPSCAARRPRWENVQFFLTPDQAEQAGYRACLRCKPKAITGNTAADGAKAICRFIEQHLDEPVTLDRLGKEFHQSRFHLQRRFKAVLGITPRKYADSCRLRLLKRNLQSGDNVTTAMYDAGYGSSSRLYERTASQLGTDRGICSILFARTDGELIEGLKREFPFATRKTDAGGLQSWVSALLTHMRGEDLDSTLPLDIRATAFQRRVWEYLQSIPFGATQSYSQVAKGIGKPTAARAVARACATNPVAVAIPCHRVVREDGSMGGYRWGIERKKALLAMEQGA